MYNLFTSIVSAEVDTRSLIRGALNDSSTSFTFSINETDITVPVDSDGKWEYVIPDGFVITSLYYAFYNKTNLSKIYFQNIDTSSCTDMHGMFYSSTSIEYLNLTCFDTSSCLNMSVMFRGCSSLRRIELPEHFGSACEQMDYLFGGTSIDVLDLTNLDTSSCLNMSYFFTGSYIGSLILPEGFGSACTEMSYMFDYANFESLDLTNLDTSSCTTMNGMFRNCESLKNLTLPENFGSACTNMSFLFAFCSSMETLDITNLNMSACKTCTNMLLGCSSLTSLTIPEGFCSACTDLSYLFSGLHFENLNLSNMSTDSCTKMNYMFSDCKELTSLTLPDNFGYKTTNMSGMFSGCNFTTLDLTKLSTSACTNISKMFSGCQNLTYLNLSTWNVSAITTYSKYSGFVPNVSTLTIDYNPDGWSANVINEFDAVNWNTVS